MCRSGAALAKNLVPAGSARATAAVARAAAAASGGASSDSGAASRRTEPRASGGSKAL